MRPQRQTGGVAVLHVRAGDRDGQQQSAGVGDDMAFAAVDVLADVIAAAGPPNGLCGPHRLGVDQWAAT